MKSINQEITNLLNKDLAIQKDLKREIINVRALAKYLREEHHLPYPIDAVISAIRRFDVEDISLLKASEAEAFFAQMSITTKDNVARLILRDKAFKEICEDFLGKKLLRENCRITKSKETVTLIIAQKDLDKKRALFKESDVLQVQKNLSEIRLQFPDDISKVKGIIARIAAELLIRDVSIEEVVYSIPDLLLYVQEKDVVQAHQALREIKNDNQKRTRIL